MGPFTCTGHFRFRVALLHLYRAFHCHMGPFYPRDPAPVGSSRVVCTGSGHNSMARILPRVVGLTILRLKETQYDFTHTQTHRANVELRAPYSQRYLFNAIPDTNHNANPTNSYRNSKGNHNPTNPTNPNTRYRCEYGTLNSMFAVTCTTTFIRQVI